MNKKGCTFCFLFKRKIYTLRFGILIGDLNLTYIFFLQSFQKRKVNGEEALDIMAYRTEDKTKSHAMNFKHNCVKTIESTKEQNNIH